MKTNIKMRVTPEQSEQVQKICLENGCVWGLQPNIIKHKNKPYLFINPTFINYGDCEDEFKEDYFEETNADLFIRTNGTCEETEENKMEWIPYTGVKLEIGKKYLVCTNSKDITVWLFTGTEIDRQDWATNITAYQQLPKPYEKPKSLKERLDEAVEKYCYEFSDEEWKDVKHRKHFIIYAYDESKFYIDYCYSSHNFSKYNFKTEKNAQSFIDSFTTDELMKIMKGEVK